MTITADETTMTAPAATAAATAPATPAAIAPPRTAERKRLLLTRPTHFDVVYSINPWMHTDVPVDRALAMRQWEALAETFTGLGHEVEVCEGVPGLPDMVFSANAGTVIDGVAVPAKFASAKRAGEQAPYTEWFREHVAHVVEPTLVNEGEGDLLWTERLLLAGSGFRTDPLAHREVAEVLGVPLVPLTLVDPYFYHLDTALAVLDAETIAFHPGAFAPGSAAAIRRLYPDAIEVGRAEAEWFALNAVSDGRNVVVPEQAPEFAAELWSRGFVPVPVDVSEFRKAGGGAKCCTLFLRG